MGIVEKIWEIEFFGLVFTFFIRYNDGIQWHDVPCFFRSKIICEDSELQMDRIKKERGVDVTVPVTTDNSG